MMQSANTLSDLCAGFITSNDQKPVKKVDLDSDIIQFAEAPWGYGCGTKPGVPPLFPVQKFILKAYYNIPLEQKLKTIRVTDKFNEQVLYNFTELDYLNFLYNEGRINIKEVTGNPDHARPNLALVIGRRGTKTSLTGIIVGYEVYKLIRKYCPQEYYKKPLDDEIRITCVATNKDQAGILFQRISNNLESSDFFNKYRNAPTQQSIKIRTPREAELYGNDGKSSIKIVASPCTGSGLRGYDNIVSIMDEIAYFFEADSSANRSDKAIYDAITPSVAGFNSPEGEPHGRIICISSPAMRSGLFFELYQRSFEVDCNDLLMIQAPSWEVNNNLSSKFLRSKFAENPTTYMVEYGAQFSDRVSAWIENEQMLRANIVPGLRLKNICYERKPHFLGADVALKHDYSAVAITHLERRIINGVPRDFIELDHIASRSAEEEGREFISPDEIAEWIASFADKFFIQKGMLDQHYGYSVLPVLQDKGLKQFEVVHMTRELSTNIYQNLMGKMLAQGPRIPEGDPDPNNISIVANSKPIDLPLVTEMLRLRSVLHSRYQIEVKAPEGKNYHDDESDAFARSVWLASDYMNKVGLATKSNIIDTTSRSGNSFKGYLREQRRMAEITGRPSAAVQRDLAMKQLYGGSLFRGSRFSGGGGRSPRG